MDHLKNRYLNKYGNTDNPLHGLYGRVMAKNCDDQQFVLAKGNYSGEAENLFIQWAFDPKYIHDIVEEFDTLFES